MELIFELPVEAPADRQRLSAHAVYELLKRAILSGTLPPGTKLPPTRSAGDHFLLSRNTIIAIYERLGAEGLVIARRGSGTFVAPSIERTRTEADESRNRVPPPGLALSQVWSSDAVARKMRFWVGQGSPGRLGQGIELRPGLVDPTLFPFDEFRRCMAKALRHMERSPARSNSSLGYQGNYQLRQAIADHVALMRAMACHPDAVIVTSGAQQAFDLLARVFVEAGQTVVAVEEPGYPPIAAPFIAAGAKVVPVPVDHEGIVVDKIPAETKLVCVTPAHQFPLGVQMSAERRQQLWKFAEDAQALIIEDDYDGEFRTNGQPFKALYGPGASERIFYVGTFSKCMFPSLRLGYLIAPEWALETLIVAKNCADWYTSSIVQTAMAAFIAQGHLSAHVARMRSVYRERKAVVLEAVEAHFGGKLRPFESSYGVHLSAEGTPEIDWEKTVQKAQEGGVQIHTLARYYSGTPSPGLLFGLGAEPKERLQVAIERLAGFAA